MNYEEKRASLVAQAQKHIDKGEISEANAIMRDIRTLDEKHEESVTAAANLAALNNVQNVSANPIASIGQGVLLTDEGQCISESAGDDKMNIFGTVEYRTAFMNKILNDKPLPEKYTNAAATTTSTTAGTIVPTTLYEKISTKLEQVGEIYSRIFRTSYPTALVIPISDIKPEANWVDEDKGTDAQKHSADKVTFAGYKLNAKQHSVCLFLKHRLKFLKLSLLSYTAKQ